MIWEAAGRRSCRRLSPSERPEPLATRERKQAFQPSHFAMSSIASLSAPAVGHSALIRASAHSSIAHFRRNTLSAKMERVVEMQYRPGMKLAR